jgi:ureidoacrylate peracid hydrolase
MEMSFPVDRTALLIIDPVNDFLSEGAGCELTKNTVKLNNVVEKIKKVTDAARAKGVAIFFGPMAYTEEDYIEAAPITAQKWNKQIDV